MRPIRFSFQDRKSPCPANSSIADTNSCKAKLTATTDCNVAHVSSSSGNTHCQAREPYGSENSIGYFRLGEPCWSKCPATISITFLAKLRIGNSCM